MNVIQEICNWSDIILFILSIFNYELDENFVAIRVKLSFSFNHKPFADKYFIDILSD